MSDSWQSFVRALAVEARALAVVERSALALTAALVATDPDAIDAADRKLEQDRRAHLAALVKRTTMQQRGFGKLPLSKICGYAPSPVRRQLKGAMAELRGRAVSIRITNRNNKALIAAGMQRLRKTVASLQQSAAEKPGTYKRRGVVPPATASILVSKSA